MVSSIGTTPAMQQIQATDRITPEQMYNPGAYAAPPVIIYNQPQKQTSFLGAVGKLILTAAVIAGGAIAARKFIPALKDYKVLDKLPDGAKTMEKVKNTFAKWTDKLYDGPVTKVVDFCKDKFNKIRAPKA